MTLELDDNVFRTTLEKAARRNRLDINTSEMLTVLRCDSTLILAPLREFDATPATALRNGVDSLFAYIDSTAGHQIADRTRTATVPACGGERKRRRAGRADEFRDNPGGRR
jgi:hypothetical protein